MEEHAAARPRLLSLGLEVAVLMKPEPSASYLENLPSSDEGPAAPLHSEFRDQPLQMCIRGTSTQRPRSTVTASNPKVHEEVLVSGEALGTVSTEREEFRRSPAADWASTGGRS
ncbi:unnamed protein product [Pleuronectes platessa]|uniref:Uncharacterized protein n=1 Tax=Pleuronectes platessa TaxID=8262 RepID=A0A9N7YG99_PLEPL|nr:unnamed protein product [Pleuronectes platessa]